MKRDLDLCRTILLTIESQPHGFADELHIDGYSEEQIGYHVYLLGEAGLLKTSVCTVMDSHSPQALPINLTWDGHEFLDASKDNSLWEKAKAKVIKPAGGVAFDLLLEWLKAEAKQRLGLPFGTPPGTV